MWPPPPGGAGLSPSDAAAAGCCEEEAVDGDKLRRLDDSTPVVTVEQSGDGLLSTFPFPVYMNDALTRVWQWRIWTVSW